MCYVVLCHAVCLYHISGQVMLCYVTFHLTSYVISVLCFSECETSQSIMLVTFYDTKVHTPHQLVCIHIYICMHMYVCRHKLMYIHIYNIITEIYIYTYTGDALGTTPIIGLYGPPKKRKWCSQLPCSLTLKVC